MARMVDKGIAVSSINDSIFYDGEVNPSFDVPIEEQRGVDIVDAWNASRTARKRILQAHFNDKKMYD